MTYKIVRFYRDSDHPQHGKVIRTGLSLAEAREHCSRPDTRKEGEWFDGYTEVKREKKGRTEVNFND